MPGAQGSHQASQTLDLRITGREKGKEAICQIWAFDWKWEEGSLYWVEHLCPPSTWGLGLPTEGHGSPRKSGGGRLHKGWEAAARVWHSLNSGPMK